MKKMLSIVLALTMLLSLSVTALATEDPAYTETPVVISVPEQDGIPAHDIPAIVTRPADGERLPGVVMLHGTGSDKNEAGGGYAVAAPILAQKGIVSIRIDFMGSGESTASYTDYNYTSATIDAKAAADYLAELSQVDPDKLAVWGWSQGGTNALLAAAAHPETFRSVVTWAGAPGMGSMGSFEDDYAVAQKDGYYVREYDWREPQKVGVRWFEEVKNTDVLAEVAKITGPILAIQGLDDTSVLPENANKIVAAASNSASRTHFIAACDHTFNVFSGDLSAVTTAAHAGGDFLNQTLTGEETAPQVTEATVGWPVVQGSEEPPANEARFYHYVPADFKFRGNSTPVIFVLGDGAWTEKSANEALTRGGFDQMAEDEDAHVVFVSPVNGKTWTADDYAVMQALATDITDDYFYEEDIQGLYDTGFAPDGRMYAGRFRSYTFAEGSAQAFVKEYLDTDEAGYWVAQWNNAVPHFGAGFHYADQFTRESGLAAWEELRRDNLLSMMDGVAYRDYYSVYDDYGIDETLNGFTASSGSTFEYYQYIPQSVDVTGASGKVPLVFVFHGHAMHPDGYIHLTDWPVTGDRYGFITVAVNGDRDNADLLELLDALAAVYPIDESRVYSTGYSMGGMKSWSLGFEHTERFAAIAPTEAIPGMGNSDIPFQKPAQALPTFWVIGEGEFFNLFPMNTPYAIDLISLLAETNGFDYNGKYDESLGKYFGMQADRTYAYNRAPGYHGDAGIWTIHEMTGADGAPSTLLSSISKLGHSAFLPESERIWQFFSHFSRSADGKSVYTVTPCTDVKPADWFAGAAAHVLDNGILPAADAGRFDPSSELTGGALSEALYALAGKPDAESAAAWASANSLAVSTASVTRGQAAEMLYAFAGHMGKDVSARADLAGYADADGAADALRWAVGAGLVSGKPGNLLDADSAITRAEAAVMLERMDLFLASA